MIRLYRKNPRYQAYLESPEWKALRKAVLKRCGKICERCHRYLVDNVHHLTYERVYHELLEDLQGLCRPCHSFLHGDSGIDPLVKSVRVKVTRKIVEYWDSTSKRRRRAKCETICQLVGEYLIPTEVFLDSEGNPKLAPAEWGAISSCVSP